MAEDYQCAAASPRDITGFDRLRLVAYPLFFASGMAGLIYQIVWARKLIYIFGSGIYAVTAVLTAFMAGLALGSAVIGRWSDRLHHPLRFYAVLEGLIGVAGLILVLALDQIHRVDAWAYARWGQDFTRLTACRFGVTFLMLMIPTTLMGATLPVLSKVMVRAKAHLGMHVSELYAINTFGAVAGAFLAGFYFIGRFGVHQTEISAATLNFFAATGALILAAVLDRRARAGGSADSMDVIEPEPSATQSEAEPSREAALNRGQVQLILFAAFASGVVSLAAQVLWSRSLIFLFDYLKNTTYAFSAMLTIFLAGLAIGSALVGLIIDRLPNAMRFYGLMLTMIGVTMAFSVFVLHTGAPLPPLLDFGDPLTEDGGAQAFNWPLAVYIIMLKSLLVLGVPTLLMGMAFPVAVRAVARARRIAGDIGSIFALNTAGAILGALLAGFVLVPLFGLTFGLMALAAADAALGLILIASASGGRSQAMLLGTLTVAAFAALIGALHGGGAMQRLLPREELVYYKEGPLATISVVRSQLGNKTINVDGIGVAGTSPILQTDQKSLAHMPMLMVRNPKKVLTVGFGSGGASFSFLLHNRLEAVHCIEICPEVLGAAPYLTEANHNVLEKNDPRYKVIFDDARTYLQYTDETYDIIATDCTDLRYKSNANLYDLDYFQFCKNKLNPGGMVVVWMPLGGLRADIFKVALRTFYKVFGNRIDIFYMSNEATHYILMNGWRDEREIDARRIAERLQEPDVNADLAELDLNDPIKLLSTFITGGEALGDFLAGDLINTEDRPILEFESPKYGYNDQPLIDNLAALMGIRRSIRPWLAEGSLGAEDLERLDRYERALPKIIEGHAAFREMRIEEAARAYLAAQAIAPEDKSLAHLLDFDDVVKHAELGNPGMLIMLGRVKQLQKRDEEALAYFEQTKQMIMNKLGEWTDYDRGLLDNIKTWTEEIKNQRRQGGEKQEAAEP